MQIDYKTQQAPDLVALNAALKSINLQRFSGLSYDRINSVLGVVFDGDDPIKEAEKEAVDEIVSSLISTHDWSGIRRQRSHLLLEADWRMNRAMDNGEDIAPLIAYRRALRDITKQESPSSVVWPDKPW